MRACILAVMTLALQASIGLAGPFTWPFYARVQPAGSSTTIDLGTDQWPDSPGGPAVTRYFTYTPGFFGPSSIGFISNPGVYELFSYYGPWYGISDQPSDPSVTVANAFDLYWGIQSQRIQFGTARGTMSVTGSGTPELQQVQFDLDQTYDLDLGDHRARVRFFSTNSSSESRLLMEISRVEPVLVPEPGSAVLAGVGVAVLALVRRRRAAWAST